MNKLLKIKLNPIEQVACAAMRCGPSTNLLVLYRQIEDAALFALAQENRIDSIVAHGLIKVLGEENTSAPWRKAHEQTTRQINDYIAELDVLSERLAQKGIKLIVLKNGGIARGRLTCPGCVPMGDLDLFNEKNDFAIAHDILLANNYTLCFRNPLIKSDLDHVMQEGGGEYWKILPNGKKLWVELSWRVVAGRWINKNQEPSTTKLFDKSQPIEGTHVRLLCPEDNLLQVCLHTAKHSYVRAPGIRLHLDVDRIMNHYAIDWSKFTAMTVNAQIKTAVYFSLIIPKVLFETPIPFEVLRLLRPGTLKADLIARLIVRAGIFQPDKQKFSKIAYIIFHILLYDNFRQLACSFLAKAGSFSQLRKLLFERINT